MIDLGYAGAQIHPVLASRWANSLKSKATFVMVANSGYLPSRVNFACRVTKTTTDSSVDLISVLESYARNREGLRERMGDDFAKGHGRATGGSISVAEFEELVEVMGFGAKVAAIPQKKVNTLEKFGFTSTSNRT